MAEPEFKIVVVCPRCEKGMAWVGASDCFSCQLRDKRRDDLKAIAQTSPPEPEQKPRTRRGYRGGLNR